MSGPKSPTPMLPSESPSLRLLAIACAALMATFACLYMTMGLIHGELDAGIDIVPAPLVSPPIMTRHEEERRPERSRPEKILPAEAPSEPGELPANLSPVEIELSSQRPIFGSLADALGLDDIPLQIGPPLTDLVPVVIVRPIYPQAAVMKEIEGFVIVQFSVRENGTVANPVVLDSEPGVLFDEAALAAASRFRFRPRQIGTDPIAVDKVQMKFAFTLESMYDIPAGAIN